MTRLRASRRLAWLGGVIAVTASCRLRYELLALSQDEHAPSTAGAAGHAGSGGAIGEGGAATAPTGGTVTNGGAEMSGAPNPPHEAGATSGGAGTGGPIVFLRLDEAAGLVAADASGTGNDGALLGFAAPGWTTAKVA